MHRQINSIFLLNHSKTQDTKVIIKVTKNTLFCPSPITSGSPKIKSSIQTCVREIYSISTCFYPPAVSCRSKSQNNILVPISIHPSYFPVKCSVIWAKVGDTLERVHQSPLSSLCCTRCPRTALSLVWSHLHVQLSSGCKAWLSWAVLPRGDSLTDMALTEANFSELEVH